MAYSNQGVKVMKKFCVLMIAVVITAIPLFLSAKDAPNGAELFRARCGTCHGKNGEGMVSAKIPPINKITMTAERLAAFITKGRSGTIVHYTPIVNLDADEANAVAAYVKNLK
jgi:cytochrome c553